MLLKRIIFILMLFSFFLASGQEEISNESCLNEDEYRLYELINEYRGEKDLPSISLSSALCYVAGAHAWDLHTNRPDQGKCNMHSWSEEGPWSSCCYTEDHEEADCLWTKPAELTDYDGIGYEVAYFNSKTVDQHNDIALAALEGWKESPGHNHMIINKYGWKRMHWRAMGVGIYGNYVVVWFGEEVDKQGEPEHCP